MSQTSSATFTTLNLNFTGSVSNAIHAYGESFISVGGNLSISTSSTLSNGVIASDSSYIALRGSTNTIIGTVAVGSIRNSAISLGQGSYSITTNAGRGLYALGSGNIRVEDLAVITIYCSGTGECAVSSSIGSFINILGSGDFVVHGGTYSISSMHCDMNGSLYFSTGRATNISSNKPTAKKFFVETGGQINVGGTGVNRFGGNQEGEIVSSSYGYYS